MKKSIYIFLIMCFVALLAVTANANEEYTIKYDFTVADILSHQIINNNPDGYIKGETVILSNPECKGYDFQGWFTDSQMNDQITEITSDSEGDITLYAKWYESEYGVNYILTTPDVLTDTSDIINPNPSSRKTSETVYLDSPSHTSGNYIFDGWFLDKEYKKPVTTIDSYTCKDVTVYAKWKKASFDIIYYMGEAEKSSYSLTNPNPSHYTFGNELILSDVITKDPAFTFEGWFTDSMFTHQVTSISKESSGSIILYAKWTVKTYDITYVLADSSGIDASTVYANNPDSASSIDDLLLSDAVSADKSFRFEGWYSDKELTKKVTLIKKGQLTPMTLYAKWETAVYNISYDYAMIRQTYLKIDNPNPQKYNFGDNTALLPIEADGFIFNGWCLDENRKIKIDSIPEESYGDIVIYADITEKTYSVSYVLGNSEVKESQVVNKNKVYLRTTTEQVSLNDAQTINKDYTFAGWYLDSEYTQKIEYIRAYTTGNITLYAKWEKVEKPVDPDIPQSPLEWGDATLSSGVTAADARLILRYSAKLESEFSDNQKKVSDINNDTKVNAADARIVLRLSAKLEKIEELKEKYKLEEL
ncbi:MAG: InlB B-repeat-containing protein [Clostridia bacterium]|nr:InlB B-repeat-containing protein [Clostridia bacterium]